MSVVESGIAVDAVAFVHTPKVQTCIPSMGVGYSMYTLMLLFDGVSPMKSRSLTAEPGHPTGVDVKK